MNISICFILIESFFLNTIEKKIAEFTTSLNKLVAFKFKYSTYHCVFSGLVQAREAKSKSCPVGHFSSDGLYSRHSQNLLQSKAFG